MSNNREENLTRKILISVALGIIMLFTYTEGLTQLIFRNAIILYALFVVSMIIFMLLSDRLSYFKEKKSSKAILDKIQIIDYCIVPVFILMTFRNAEISQSTFQRYASSMTFWAVWFFASETDGWIKIFIRYIKIFGFFFAIATVFLALNKSLMQEYVFPLFENHTPIEKQLYYFQAGYLTGFAANPTLNACYLLPTSVVYFCGFLNEKKWSKRLLNITLSFVFMALVLTTGKRAHILFGLFCMTVIYFMNSQSNIRKKMLTVTAFMMLFGVLILFCSKYIPAVQGVYHKFVNQFATGRIGSGRRKLWIAAWYYFKSKPIFGNGWDTYKYMYLEQTDVFKNAHNCYLQLLCETGVVGLTFYVAFFAVSLSRAICVLKKAIRSSAETETVNHLCVAVCLQLYFILYCITENPLYDAITLSEYLLACATGEYYFRRIKE